MINRYLHILTSILLAVLPVVTTAQTDSTNIGADTIPKAPVVDKYPAGHKTVAVISAFTQDSPWSNDYIPPVTMAAANVPNTHCEVYYMNSLLVTDSVAYNEVKKNMFENFRDKTPDYVVMIGKMPFAMRDDMVKEWGNVPMLLVANSANIATQEYYYSGVEQRDEDKTAKKTKLTALQKDYNFTAVVVPYFYNEIIDLIVETMNHEVNELVYVGVPTYIERHNSTRMSEYIVENYPGIKFRWLDADESNSEKLRSLLIEREKRTAILLSNWATVMAGPQGYPIITNQELRLLSSSVNPVFVTTESLVDDGAVGGVFCDKDIVNSHIINVMTKMLNGKKDINTVPVWVCEKYSTVINYPKAVKYGLNLSELDSNADIIGRTPSFWQKYHWEVLGIGFVVLLIVFVLWKRSQMQASEIAALQNHRRFVESMPIAYGHACIQLSEDGKNVVNVVYTELNEAMQDLINTNGNKSGEYILFPRELVLEKAKEMYEKKNTVDFVHHFENTDTYYDVFVDVVNRGEKNNDNRVKEVDIFAVDVTSRVHMEEELKELSHKLDLTINVAGIIPWEWDVKTDVMRFDAYSLFGRELHDIDDMQHSPSTYLDTEEEYLPLIHPDDTERVHQLRNDMLTRERVSFRVRYRLRVVRNGEDMYQWVEARGNTIKFDSKGGPELCAGGMWLLYDDDMPGEDF